MPPQLELTTRMVVANDEVNIIESKHLAGA